MAMGLDYAQKRGSERSPLAIFRTPLCRKLNSGARDAAG
jgi:hypothetical protein